MIITILYNCFTLLYYLNLHLMSISIIPKSNLDYSSSIFLIYTAAKSFCLATDFTVSFPYTRFLLSFFLFSFRYFFIWLHAELISSFRHIWHCFNQLFNAINNYQVEQPVPKRSRKRNRV